MDKKPLIHITDHLTDRIVAVLENKEKAPLFWSDSHVETLKNEETFDFQLQAKMKDSAHVSKRNRVIIPDEDGFYREFIISETYQSSTTKEVRTMGSFVELGKQRIIEPVTLQGQTISTAAAWVLEGTDWKPGQMDYAGIRTVEFKEHVNALKAIHELKSLFELEVRFRIEIAGNKVAARYVDFLKKRGRFRGKEVVFGKDLIGVKRREQSDVCTALVGLGPVKSDGTRLSVVVTDQEALKRWGRKGKHLFDIYEPESDNENMTIETLTQLTEEALKKRINTAIEYEADSVAIEHIFGFQHEKVRLGDTVRIKDTSFDPPLYLESRVISVERSVKNPSKKKYILGDFIEYRAEDVMRNLKLLKTQIAMKTTDARVEAFFAENTYTKTDIDLKDQGVYTDSTYYADQVASTAEENAKTAVQNGEVPVPTSVLTGPINVATNKIQSADSKFFWDVDGNLYAVNPSNPKKIVKFSSEGIGLSTNGIGGPYGTAILADGIDASLITVGKMLFDRLQGGILTLGGLNNQNGILQLLNSNGELIGDFNSDRGGFADLFVANLRGNNVLTKTTQDVTYYVSSYAVNAGYEPSDDNDGTSGWNSALRTLTEALRRIPNYIEHNVTIQIAWSSKLFEHVDVSGFFGPGKLTIQGYDHSCILSGRLSIRHNLVDIEVKTFRLEGRNANYNVAYISNSAVTFNGFRIDGNNAQFGYDCGFGGYVRFINNCQAYYVQNGVRSGYGAFVSCEGMSGSVTNTALLVYMGIASGYGSLPSAPTATANNYGAIYGNFSVNAGTAPPPIIVSEKTDQWTQTASESWRQNDGWAGASTGTDVIQGYWGGWGRYYGLWFFGSAPSTAVTGKTIKQIRIWVQRKSSGGVSGSVPIVFRPHGYTSRPAGQPSFLGGGTAFTTGFKPGEGKWVTLPSSFHTYFNNGSAKGIGIYVDSSASGDYSRMIGTAKLEITYS